MSSINTLLLCCFALQVHFTLGMVQALTKLRFATLPLHFFPGLCTVEHCGTALRPGGGSLNACCAENLWVLMSCILIVSLSLF